tara:strand:+ start:1338 stop:1634 length:297 start_codon:yes stop_codon:yes gene_type:complete
MDSKYLEELELLNRSGYFMGLNDEKFYKILIHNYETGSDEEKKFMDENCKLLLDRYKNGVVQTNLIYNKISSIQSIMVFFLVLVILGIIANFIILFKN